MSGLFSGKNSTPASTPVTQLRLQTSTRGRPIPLVYGKTRVAGNLIWYGDFTATGHKETQGGKGGGGGVTTTTFAYSAALMMGVCEGEINSFTRVWRQKEIFVGDTLLTVTTGYKDKAYTVPASGEVFITDASWTLLTESVTVDSGSKNASRILLTKNTDYTRSGMVYQFNLAFVGRQVYISFTKASNIPASVDGAIKLGLTTAVGSEDQTSYSWMATAHADQTIYYRQLAYVSSQKYPLGNNGDLLNHSFEVDTKTGYSDEIRDANPKDVLVDILTNTDHGAGFPASRLGDAASFSTYCVANNIFISPAYLDQLPVKDIVSSIMKLTNSGVVYSNGKLQFVPLGDIAATANGVTFTPNITPIYDLTDDDFIGDASSDPIRIFRKSNADCHNSIKIKFYDRANNYNEEVVEAKDQANIEQFGLRMLPVIELKEICNAVAARNVAQLILQRDLYIRATYEFNLGWNKSLLEPMDLVTLTDSSLAMNKVPVRVLTIEEDEWGGLAITAEEFPNNVCNAALYNIEPPLGYAANFNVNPGNCTVPAIFEPAIELAVSKEYLDIWIATGGGANYGGCEVWLSIDNATYKREAVISGKSRYGTITSSMASRPVPNTYSESVNVLLKAGGQLLSGTVADNTLLNTLCFVGGEFIGYQTATLTGTNAYTLSTLNRGVFGSTQPAHSAGQDFVRIDDDVIAKIPLTLDYIGKTIYVKLLAYNSFGGGLQSLAEVNAYSFLVTGRFVKLPPPDVSVFTLTVKPDGTRQFNFNPVNAPKDVTSGGGYIIKYRTAGSGTAWASMTTLNTGVITQSPYETNNPIAGTYDFAIVALDKLSNESLAPLFISNAAIGNEPVTYGSSANMLANSDWLMNTGGIKAASWYRWGFFGTITGGLYGGGRNSTPWNIGRGGIWMQDVANIGTTNFNECYQSIAVIAGMEYEFSAIVNPHRCSTYIQIEWYNASNVVLGTVNSDVENHAGYAYTNGLAGYPMIWGKAVAPATCTRAVYTIHKQATNAGSADSYVFLHRAMFCVARPGVTKQTATPWSEAGIDFVHGGGIEPLTVGTLQIAQYAATDVIAYFNTNIGFQSSEPISMGSVTVTAPNNCTVIVTAVMSYHYQIFTGSGQTTVCSPNIGGINTSPVAPSPPVELLLVGTGNSGGISYGSVTTEKVYSMSQGQQLTFYFTAQGGCFGGNPKIPTCETISIKAEVIKK